jgi:hypothetical protein
MILRTLAFKVLGLLIPLGWVLFNIPGGSPTPPVPPAIPVGISPANNAVIPSPTPNPWVNRPTFHWNKVSGVGITYDFELTTDVSFPNEKTEAGFELDRPAYLPGGPLMNNQVYFWRVRACTDRVVCSPWSPVYRLLVRPATPVYKGESSLGNTNEFKFSWTDLVQNWPAKYNVQICYDAACASLYKSATVNNWEYQLVLPINKAMWWRVQGVGVTTSDWMLAHHFHTLITPGAPVLLSPPDNSLVPHAYKIDFSWTPVAGATTYDIQVTDDPEFRTHDNYTTSPNFSGQWDHGTVYWRVRAGIGDTWGQWSQARRLTLKPSIAGHVVDLDGNPLAGAEVRPSSIRYYVTTNDTGIFVFPELPAGKATLSITRGPDYLPLTTDLTLANGIDNGWEFSTVLPPVNTTLNSFRFVLRWNVQTAIDLDLHAWLPKIRLDHISVQNEGTLAAFPEARLSWHDHPSNLEVMDIDQFYPGKYVLAVSQKYPAGSAWAESNPRVEVYFGANLVSSCASPAGSGAWWYVMDIQMDGVFPAFTCKNRIQADAPAPYADNMISGAISTSNGRPLSGVTIDYGKGYTRVDSPFVLNGLGPGKYALKTSKPGWSFSPSSIANVPAGAANVRFVAVPLPETAPGGSPSAVAVQGDYLYVGGGGKLYVIDVKDRSKPVEKAAFWIAPGAIEDLVVEGNYAYVAEGDSGLSILDISDPSHPKFVGLYEKTAHSVVVAGGYAYLTADGVLTILDVHDLSKPTFVSNSSWFGNLAARVAVNGNLAYLVGGRELRVLDIRDPKNPTTVSRWESDQDSLFIDAIWRNNYLFAIDNFGMYSIDVSDPTHPFEVPTGRILFHGAVLRSTRIDNTLVLAGTGFGMRMYDMSDPRWEPQFLGEYRPQNYDLQVKAAVADESYAYVIDGASILIFKTPGRPDFVLAGKYTPAP